MLSSYLISVHGADDSLTLLKVDYSNLAFGFVLSF